MKIKIKQGQCRINSSTLLVDTDDCKVVLFDTKDKYPKYWCMGGSWVELKLDEHSPSYKSRKNFDKTTIEFYFAGEDWNVVTGQTGRYSFYITAFKESLLEGAGECDRSEWYDN